MLVGLLSKERRDQTTPGFENLLSFFIVLSTQQALCLHANRPSDTEWKCACLGLRRCDLFEESGHQPAENKMIHQPKKKNPALKQQVPSLVFF
jgi:hypothetical protein